MLSVREREKERGREKSDRLSLSSWLTRDSNFVEERQTFSLCSPPPVSLTLSDRRFIVLKSAVFCGLASLLIKAVFFFSHYAAWSGDRPFNAAL